MSTEQLDIDFEKYVGLINEHTEPFPADVLLQLYAYYKKATRNQGKPNSKKPMINAFKTNALFQIQSYSVEDAKEAYIELAKSYLNKNK